jgi:formyl-CoA transferase
MSATPGVTKWLGPALGEHNEEVLTALGYAQDEIDRLRDDNVI